MADALPKPKRIAVLAVHGIANHAAGETSRAVADLLLTHGSTGGVVYTPYDQADIRMATARVDVPDPVIQTPASSRFDERSNFVRTRQHSPVNARAAAEAAAVSAEDADAFGFMRDQLRNFRITGSDAVYETQRLRTTRRENGNDLEVHVFEMYWANLSRLGTGFIRFFGELYQLLFHLGSIGRQTADFAWAAHAGGSGGPWWHTFQFLVAWAVRFLTLGIPVLNLLLLATVCFPLPGHLLGSASEPASLLLLATVGGIGAVWGLFHFRKVPWMVWVIFPLLTATALLLLGVGILRRGLFGVIPIGELQLIALESCAVLAVGIAIVLGAYSRRRPGASSVGLWLGGPFLIVGAFPLIIQAGNSDVELFAAALKLVEFIFLGLLFCWIALLACSWLSAIIGALALAFTRGTPAEHSRAVRAVQTACLAVSLPSIMFLVITIVLYRALSQAGAYVFPLDFDYQPSQLLVEVFGFRSELPALTFLNDLIVASATPGFVLVLVALAVSLVLAIWALLPVILSDLKPPADSNQRSVAMGNWLSHGYRLLIWAGVIVFVAFPTMLTLGMVLQWLNRMYDVVPVDSSTSRIISMLGALIVGSVSGLLAFNGRLDQLALGFRPLLDTILDVDNYLREHPRDFNPRARICARYRSLLQFLCEWQDPRDGGTFDGLIIVSHSQGTVISAELLRFLNQYRNAQGPWVNSFFALPIYLFTMGCPLRQLYGWRFPHLYAWTRHSTVNPWSVGDPAYIPDDQQPDPGKLGVKKWINAFRSGDYVGRYLWRSDACDYHWGSPDGSVPVVSEDTAGTRREFCVGAGGHNHYFDDTAPVVARELDQLIANMAYGTALESPFQSLALGLEQPEPDESALIQRIVDVSEALLDRSATPVQRGQHPKQHACVKAKFEVLPGLPAALQIGIFKTARTYDAYVRFSNGRELDDAHGDIHGMAIKVLGVPEDKVLVDERTAQTQDFVLIDSPAFFIRNLTDYAPFSQMLLHLRSAPRWWVMLRIFGFFLARGQFRQLQILGASRSKLVGNPLDLQYWSTTPSLLGDQAAVKYSARPVHDSSALGKPGTGPNYLREALARRLDSEDVRFDFMVQLQKDPLRHPIEDPTVQWDSEWIGVASLLISKQALDDTAQKELGERLAFTPWHTLPMHRPLGGINRARKEVYSRLSRLRRSANETSLREPRKRGIGPP